MTKYLRKVRVLAGCFPKQEVRTIMVYPYEKKKEAEDQLAELAKRDESKTAVFFILDGYQQPDAPQVTFKKAEEPSRIIKPPGMQN